MKTRSLSTAPISRRAFPKVVLAGALGISSLLTQAAAIAQADERMSVGTYIRTYDPEGYALMDPATQASLNAQPMAFWAEEAPSLQADTGGSVSLSAWPASGSSIGYSFTYWCNTSCSSLRGLVSISNSNGTTCYTGGPFYGSGTGLTGGGTAYGLSSGRYSVVVTVYMPSSSTGGSLYYAQDWSTVYI